MINESIQETSQNSHMRRAIVSIARWIPWLVVFVVFAVGNILIPQLFWRMTPGITELLAMFFNGILASEIAILTLWSALACIGWASRIAVSFLTLVLMASTCIAGLRLPDSGLPVHVAIIIYCISIVGFVCHFIPLSILRLTRGWKLTRPGDLETSMKQSQFSISFLLGITTMVAILYTIVRASLPTAASQGMPPIWQLAVASFVYTIYSILLLLPSFYLGFGSKHRWLAFIALLLQFLFIAPLIISCLTYFAGIRFDANSTFDFYSFSLGYVTSIVSVTLGLRACCFRLIARESRQSTMAVLPD